MAVEPPGLPGVDPTGVREVRIAACCERCLKPLGPDGRCRRHPWAARVDPEAPDDAAWVATLRDRRSEGRRRQAWKAAMAVGAGLAMAAGTLAPSLLWARLHPLWLHAVVLCALAAGLALAGVAATLHGLATRKRPDRGPVEPGLQADLAAIRAPSRLRRRVALLAVGLWLPAAALSLLGRAALQGDGALGRALRGAPSGADVAFSLAHGSVLALAVAAALGALLAVARRRAPATLSPAGLGLPPLLNEDGLPGWWSEEAGSGAQAPGSAEAQSVLR